MKYFLSKIILSSVVILACCAAYADENTKINQFSGIWEQTQLSNSASTKECRIESFLTFRYVLEKENNSMLTGYIVQTDYRFNITSPPNPTCEFKDTVLPNVLLNVKKWRIKANYNEKDELLELSGHSGECKKDRCKSATETDFTTQIFFNNDSIIDNFGTNTKGDDIYLIRENTRDTLFSSAKKVALQVEKYMTENNCSGLVKIMSEKRQQKLAEDYVATCTQSGKSKLAIKTVTEMHRFLSYNPSGPHWAIFANKITYVNKTENSQLMYLVYEDSHWKFWNVY